MVYQATLSHFWQFFFAPAGQPWYQGGVYGNIVAMVPCAFLGGFVGWLWSRTKYWPLNLIHAKLDSLHAKHDLHAKKLDDITQHLVAIRASHKQLHQRLDRMEGQDSEDISPRGAEVKARRVALNGD